MLCLQVGLLACFQKLVETCCQVPGGPLGASPQEKAALAQAGKHSGAASEMLCRGETEDSRHPCTDPWPGSETHALGIPDTSLSGLSTRTALSVRRSNSVPTVAKMLEERSQSGKQRVGFRVRQEWDLMSFIG